MSRRPGRPRGGPPMAERVRVYRSLATKGVRMRAVAQRMGVSYRTVQEYARRMRQEDGVTLRRGARSAQQPEKESAPQAAYFRPLVLAHLRRWPHSELSVYELARMVAPRAVWGYPTSTVGYALKQLVAEGLVDLVVGVRDPGHDHRPVRRYRLRPGREATP